MRCFTVSYPPSAPCKGVYYTILGARGLCPLLTWPTLKTIRGTCQDRTAGHLTTGCLVVRLQVWHPWLVLETSLVLRHAITWSRCFFASTVPNQFRNSVWGQKPPFLGNTTTTTTHDCWQQNIQFGQRQCSEMPYYFSCIMVLLFTEQSVYSNSN
jgi:predicted membrane-bound mannosyltransferase